jgi:hypothetical protein
MLVDVGGSQPRRHYATSANRCARDIEKHVVRMHLATQHT